MPKIISSPLSRPELELRARDALNLLVSKLPSAILTEIQSLDRGGPDLEFRLELPSGKYGLICTVRTRAWANELHAVVHGLKEIQKHRADDEIVCVLIAPFLSDVAIELCEKLRISWVDLSGNCELKIGSSYIRIRGNQNSHNKLIRTPSLYTPRSSKVVHALLLDPSRKWTTQELAKETGVSLGQISSVKKALESIEWLDSGYGHTSVTHPQKLLEDWCKNYRPRRNVVRLFTLDSPAVLEARIQAALPDYAFAEFSAADRYSTYTRYQRVSLYVKTWEQSFTEVLGLKPADGAANVTIYETEEGLAFTESFQGSRCASPILTYLDLSLLQGRGQDAANHLLETIIKLRWK